MTGSHEKAKAQQTQGADEAKQAPPAAFDAQGEANAVRPIY